MRVTFLRMRLYVAAATTMLLLGGCATANHHDPFDRSISPTAQSVMGGSTAGPSVKVLLSGGTAASMKEMAGFSDLMAEMLNPASMVDAVDPVHFQEELNQVLSPHFRSIDYAYWNAPDDGQSADYTLTLEISTVLGKHSFAENIVDLNGVLTGPDPGKKDIVSGHGTSKMGFPATTYSFTLAREAAFREFAESLNGSRLLADYNNGSTAAASGQSMAATLPSSTVKAMPPSVAQAPKKLVVRGGVYDVESKIEFNVLDSVYFDAANGQFALIGHHDDRFKNKNPIPYLQYLATLLECPKPEFSLAWTPDSSRQVDALLARELTQEESDAQATRLGNMVDSSGNITRTGELMLPALGISPISGHRAPGDLGIEVASAGNGQVAIMKIRPGSAAEKAGLHLIDFIYSVGTDEPVFYKSEFVRRVRFAGAGSSVKITYFRQGNWYTTWATLDEAEDTNPWTGVNNYDLIGLLYRNAGDPVAANLMESMGIMNTMITEKEPYAGLSVMSQVMDALGMAEDFKHIQAVGANSAPPYQDSYNFSLRVAQQMDSIFHFAGNPMQACFQSSIQQTNNPATAVSAIFNAFGSQLVPKVGELIDRLILRPGAGFQIPPELVEDEYHIHPEMVPEYMGVPQDSQLAQLMLAGDCLCKEITNRQELKSTIPGYQTQVEYQINHPDGLHQSGRAYRVWTSVAGVDAAQSSDGKTLAVRGARMHFNVRLTDNQGNDIESGQPDPYGDFLTSLYDPLEQLYPVLHNVREAAKLAAVAAWMRKQSPDVHLPLEGQATWNSPATVKGLVYIYLTQNLQGESKIIKIAEGGLSFDLNRATNPILFPVDPSVVDLRGNPSFATLFTKPAGASVGESANGTSSYVASWVAPVAGGAPGQQAVVLQAQQAVAASPFGTKVSNPTLDKLDPNAALKTGTDTSANHQLNAIAKSLQTGDTSEAQSANAQLGLDKITTNKGAVDASGIQTPPSEPEEIQIPASMINDKDLAADMLKLTIYKQQAKQSRTAAAAAQAKFDAEKKTNPQSAKLPVLMEQAREAQDKAGNLDNMVKVQTKEIKRKISFAKINTDGDGGSAPQVPAPAPEQDATQTKDGAAAPASTPTPTPQKN